MAVKNSCSGAVLGQGGCTLTLQVLFEARLWWFVKDRQVECSGTPISGSSSWIPVIVFITSKAKPLLLLFQLLLELVSYSPEAAAKEARQAVIVLGFAAVCSASDPAQGAGASPRSGLSPSDLFPGQPVLPESFLAMRQQLPARSPWLILQQHVFS